MPDLTALDGPPGARRASYVDADGAYLNTHDLILTRNALADAITRRVTMLESCRDCGEDGPCPRHAVTAEAVVSYRSLAARLAPKGHLAARPRLRDI